MLTAVIALVGSLLSVIFTLDPGLKPDPLDRVGAAITIFAVSPNVTLGDWAPEAYPNAWRTVYQRTFGTTTPTADQLGVLGDVIYVRTQVDGYKHRAVKLAWTVYNGSYGSRDLLDGGRIDLYKSIPAPQVLPLPIDAPSRSSVQLLFIPAIGQLVDTPKTFVRVELVDPKDGQTLAVTDTQILNKGVPGTRSNPS